MVKPYLDFGYLQAYTNSKSQRFPETYEKPKMKKNKLDPIRFQY